MKYIKYLLPLCFLSIHVLCYSWTEESGSTATSSLNFTSPVSFSSTIVLSTTGITGAGAGSGLDADLLDGVQGSSYLTGTTAATTYLPLSGGALTGPLTGTNAGFTYGVSAATGVISGAVSIGGVLTVTNDMSIGAGNKLDLGGASGNGGFRIMNNIAHYENGQGGAKRAFALVDFVNRSADYSTPVGTPVSPTFFVFSSTPVASDSTQWISMTHNSFSGVMNSGKGGINLACNVGISSSTPVYPLTMEAGGVGGYYSSTDHQWHNGVSYEIYKENIKDIALANPLLSLKNIRLREYNYKVEESTEAVKEIKKVYGYIADELPPNMASYTIGENGGLTMNGLFVYATSVMQALQNKIEELEARIEELENK